MLASLQKSALLQKLRQQTLVIVGLGQEGWSSYQFLRSALPEVQLKLFDEKSVAELDQNWSKTLEQDQKLEWLADAAELKAIAGPQTVIFKTPGIPSTKPLLQTLFDRGSQLSANTQLFFELIQELADSDQVNAHQSKFTTIGVTGTKGKSTTTALIHHVLAQNGLTSFLGGNIGRPALTCLQQWQKGLATTDNPPQRTFFVLELSSHQLAELTMSPDIAVVQTIVSEHLDYYPDFTSYFAAKTNLVRHQQANDWVLYNQDDTHANRLAKLSPGRQTGFSLKQPALTTPALIKMAQQTPLLGRHNLYNTLPAILISQELGLKEKAITQALKTFTPLPHRLQLIAEINGVKFYDDSIATNPKATRAALETFADQPVILLAGGYERQQDFSQLAAAINHSSVKALALFPPTGHRLKTELEKLGLATSLAEQTQTFTEMKAAVEFAADLAQPGDVILLSPAAASFGLFENYQDRGQQFAQATLALSNSND